jgi:poly-gamma-glutamate synthesis protein (capsule biosynthesis protein)
MIASGADIISGHHPHWIQTTEEIDGKLVYYSLGNFVFDQMWSEETKTGLMVKLLIDEDDIKELKQHKVYMENWAQPKVLENNEV